MKERKGISLIVLVVTIIVMIIIAGAIIISLTQTNVIEQAENATSEYNLKVEKEKIQLALNEWLLEKNTSANPKAFKAFIAEALPDDTVSGADNGPITVKISDTKNIYNVTENGEIELAEVKEPTDLDKYFFGEDLQGRDLISMLSESETSISGMDFIDDESTEINEREVLEFITGQNINRNDYTTVYQVFSDTRDPNNTIIYKVVTKETNDGYMTMPEYGIIKETEMSEFVGTNVGKTVSYDNKLWTIMYDDEINGLQMVCNESQLYNGATFKLGKETSSITDWNTVLSEADLDDSGDLTDFEKAVYSYNNAIDILNTACESLVAEHTNILDVRCLGSNPVNKDSENETLYTSELLATLPETSDMYPAGIANGKLKSADANYISDVKVISNMAYLTIYPNIYMSDPIWLASRTIDEDKYEKHINILIGDDSILPGINQIIFMDETSLGLYSGGKDGSLLLPVVKLNPNVEFSGAGTVDSPYTF